MRSALILMVVLVCFAHSAVVALGASVATSDEPSYAVYSAVLRHLTAHVEAPFLIGDSTVAPPRINQPGTPFFPPTVPDLAPETWRDFSLRNNHSARIAPEFETSPATRVLLTSEADSLFRPRGRYEPEPEEVRGSMLYRLSRVGFNADSTQALVYVQTQGCKGRCGGGRYFMLVRQGSRWAVAHEALVFVV
jgi:hypothetical protein